MVSWVTWLRSQSASCCPQRSRPRLVAPEPVRAISVQVPVGATPGLSKLQLEVLGRQVTLPVPREASVGDTLTLVQDDGKSWRVTIKRTSLIPRRPVLTMVPGDAIPGVSEAYVDTLDGSAIRVRIPDGAQPGDILSLSRKTQSGEWQCSHRHCDRDLSPPNGVTEAVDLKNYAALRAASEENGAVWSGKIGRGRAPPLHVSGMIANVPLVSGEEIGRVPRALFITPNVARNSAPELCRQVDALGPEMPRDQPDLPVQAAFLTQLLAASESGAQCAPDAQQISEQFAGVCGMSEQAEAKVWSAHVSAMLSESFEAHPYRKALQDPVQFRALLKPSPEADLIEFLAQGVLVRYEVIVRSISPEVLGPGFTAERFLRAWLLIITRSFNASEATCLVPHMDGFNHTPSGESVRVRWDAASDAIVAETTRDVAAGEELKLSYGALPNPVLFRSYGFTCPASDEPGWMYISRPISCQPILKAHLPASGSGKMIEFDSRRLDVSVSAAMETCASNRKSVSAFLKELLEFRLGEYAADPQIQSLMQGLSKLAVVNHGGDVTWRGMLSGSGCGIAADVLDSDATRVKISEYLCLRAHLEALEPREDGGQCLTFASAALREELHSALQAFQRQGVAADKT